MVFLQLLKDYIIVRSSRTMGGTNVLHIWYYEVSSYFEEPYGSLPMGFLLTVLLYYYHEEPYGSLNFLLTVLM